MPVARSLPPVVVLAALLASGNAALPAPGHSAGQKASPQPPSFGRAAVKPKPGYATGRCVTAQGKPLAGVRIRVFGVTKAGESWNGTGTTDAAGIYSIRLPAGLYHVGWALYDTRLAGKPYSLPLHPADGQKEGDGLSSVGIVKSFVLKLNGLIDSRKDPDNDLSYYGGSIVVQGGALKDGSFLTGYTYRFPENAALELTLTPTGPLLDGSEGKELLLKTKLRISGGSFLDIPAGRYRATARLINEDGSATPIRLAAATFSQGGAGTFFHAPGPEDFKDSADIVFPSNGDSIPIMSLPGVQGAKLYAQP